MLSLILCYREGRRETRQIVSILLEKLSKLRRIFSNIQMSGTGNGHSTKFPLSITARSMYDLLINSILWLQYERNTLFDFRC